MIGRIGPPIAALVLVAPAHAQPAPVEPAWTASGQAGVVSDYRYRGISMSGRDPAAQFSLTASHRSGAYADAWVSTITEYGEGPDGDGATVETALSLGWSGGVRGFDIDVAASAYLYPDGTKVSYVEFPAQVGQTLGPVTWALGGAYAPAQSALGDRDNGYVWGGLDYAARRWPVTASVVLGYETGAYAPGGKTDWSLGLETALGRMRLGLAWIDSDQDPAALVGRLAVGF